MHHNLGVIAARRRQWERAIEAFKRAIELEPLTADTVNQLQALHEYRARQAWQVALQLDNNVETPEFSLQTSSNQNRPPCHAIRAWQRLTFGQHHRF